MSALLGGIDLGGTKIESALFDAGLEPAAVRRRVTPTASYEELVEALHEEIGRLREVAGEPNLPVGIGVPGMIEPRSGRVLTPNLPASGRPLGADVAARAGGRIVLANDGRCFALSEANGGAGDGCAVVLGLVLGTGLGGGVCVDGNLMPGPNALAGEVGHAALPAPLVRRHGLPLTRCGCGREGCFETCLSGAGLERLGEALAKRRVDAPRIAALAASGDRDMNRVLDVWYEIAGELLHALQLHLDPDVVVVGGGLSRLPGIEARLAQAMARSAFAGLVPPRVRVPKHGDSSGTRGAALLAAGARPDKGMPRRGR